MKLGKYFTKGVPVMLRALEKCPNARRFCWGVLVVVALYLLSPVALEFVKVFLSQ